MASYEACRLENIKRNESLVKGLGLRNVLDVESKDQSRQPAFTREPPPKRPKLSASRPTRVSARIANAPSKLNYSEDAGGGSAFTRRQFRHNTSTLRQQQKEKSPLSPGLELQPQKDIEVLKAGWSSWLPSAKLPTCDKGNYHFESHPMFTPSKSLEAMIREGIFGGSYWRPLYSRHLRTTISDDWQELPASWIAGLSVERYLTSPTYDPEVNKYGVACGQSIERLPAGLTTDTMCAAGSSGIVASGWAGGAKTMNDRLTGRGSTLAKPVDGEEHLGPGYGYWLSRHSKIWSLTFMLIVLKKYIQNGVRTVTNEDDEVDEKKEVSPVVHQKMMKSSQVNRLPSQTCHHWVWEVRQEALDRFWSDGT
ncbi:hypothetical protein RRF57_003292 [Xylaria bambusicola]|uniref:Uncharacterized protein n=1 Tax=Xylaria bambusicola TaxID=326684 RepID=A0AAN7Z397_9PEZI